MDVFNAQTIKNLNILANTRHYEMTRKKKLMCLLVNGFPENEMNTKHRWNKNPTAFQSEIIEKEQWFHSAASIFMLLKYPRFQKEDSFINIMNTQELKSIFFTLATHVLMNDIDGIQFMKDLETVMSPESDTICFVDDKNSDVIVIKNEDAPIEDWVAMEHSSGVFPSTPIPEINFSNSIDQKYNVLCFKK